MAFKKIVEIADALTQEKTPEGVFELFLSHANSLGIDFLFMGRWNFLLSKNDERPDFYRSNMPEWSKVYIEKEYIHIDPFLHLAMRINRAFYYQEALHDLTPAQVKFVSHAKEYGLHDGFVVPIHRSLGAPGGVTMGARNPLNMTKMEELTLELLAHLSYTLIDGLKGTPQEIEMMRLKDRERTVLTLVARGKTNWEIGVILSISEYSVRDYLKALSNKLGTQNRTHTVVRAMQLGLISP